MTVQIFDLEDKKNMYAQWVSGDYETKVALANAWDTSTRTLNRIIDEMRSSAPVEDDVAPIEGVITPTELYLDGEDEGEEDWDDDWDVYEYDDEDDEYDDDEEFYRPLVSWPAPVVHTYNFVASPQMLSIVRDDSRTVTITSDSDKFGDACARILSAGGTGDVLHQLFSELDVQTIFDKYSKAGLNIDVEAGRVFYLKGNLEFDFHGRLVSRIIRSLQEDGEGSDMFDGLVAFTQLLVDNPSERAVNELYDFLEANDIEITKDGMVRCWKKITDDYKDIYTGTLDNSLGTTVSVPRHRVNPDSNITCSYGLHVCSKSYLPCYGGYSARVVKVLVSPADFVSIPTDYNNAKARVCKYIVEDDASFEEYTDYV